MKRLALFAILLPLLLSTCKRQGTPPQITVGTTECAADGRVINNVSLAGVARSSDGTVKAFDRAACLLRTIPPGDEWQVWFHDHDSPNWIEASKAVFVIQRRGPGGPVRHINAFVDEKQASAFYKRTPGRNEIAPDYAILRGVMSRQ